MPPVVVDANRIAEVLTTLVNRLQESARMSPPPFSGDAPLRVETAREQRVNWDRVPKLDLARGDQLDNWFLSFESRMQAARVLEENWPLRFLECPGVEEAVKVRIRDIVPLTYRNLRRAILKEHGPIDPVNFFKRAIFKVRGSSREDVKEKLLTLLTSHNRAAEDEGIAHLHERDLCYPFIDAFVGAVKVDLERQLALVFAQENPFEHLFRLAPSKVTSELALLEQVPSGVDDYREESAGGCECCAMHVTPRSYKRERGFKQQIPFAKRGRAKQAKGPDGVPLGGTLPQVAPSAQLSLRQGSCQGCGRECPSRSGCPANNKTCSKCGKLNHFARVCRAHPFVTRPACP